MDDLKGHLWEDLLEKSIDDLAKTVLYDLVRWEFEQLAARDPSFDDLAKNCRRVLAKVESFVQESTRAVRNFQEMVEILESIAQSIVDREVRLLVDCTAHLQEFIEIRQNGGANHE